MWQSSVTQLTISMAAVCAFCSSAFVAVVCVCVCGGGGGGGGSGAICMFFL